LQWGEPILPKNYWIMKWLLMWVIGNGQQEPDVMQLLTLGFSIRNPTEKI
jgi:hypothetical protein